MTNTGKLFYLHKRNRNWYARFKLQDGTLSTAITCKETSKVRAERWAFEQIKTGNIQTKSLQKDILFKSFVKDFFDWNGAWATNKKVSNKRISRRHCIERNKILDIHLLPRFAEMKLSNIDRLSIKNFRNELFAKGYSGSRINHILSALKSILDLAEEMNIIGNVPKIERAAEKPKSKGILSLSEVRQIFSPEIKWDDYRTYVANFLAAVSGLRIGEILALQEKDINFIEKYISIKKSWDIRLYILNETTKTGKNRRIIVPEKVLLALQELLKQNPYPATPNRFVFYGCRVDTPIEHTRIRQSLYLALVQIGIDKEAKVERNLTFHSWRHFFNSMLINARIPIQKIQSITGHLTNEMTEHYYHPDEMKDVILVQERLLA